MADTSRCVRLRVVTPAGAVLDIRCDSVRLNAADEQGGGSLGIRHGHMPAMIVLERGRLTAFSEGEKIKDIGVGGGVATVSDDVVTVLATEIF